ncbi:DNA-repair protein [Latilactobacillus sakei]|uniref:DEAD/DEAH box helicase family protein n=1 Tax=Latilactobacillus sakei TaxID=1599 RepID=UPI000977D2DA|nr:DEAD/DEAH box helicase family protein [Latilactobacillus sakei]GEA77564.1 DNA-repair protein [Latilactobacillus sakei]SOB39845.1 Type III restriction enzyme, res subunit [Latilactobacillus sakei]
MFSTDLKNLKIQYRTTVNQVIDEFYVPVLSKAVRYDRAVGYFSSNILIAYIDGLEKFVENNGKIRLIISPFITKKDGEVFLDSINKISSVSGSLNELFRNFRLDGNDAQISAQILYRLIMDGILEVRVIVPNNNLGLFHEKIALFYDELGDTIAINGSNNETQGSVEHNLESFSTFRSWINGQELYIDTFKEQFEDTWQGNLNEYHMLSLQEAVDDDVLREYETDESIKTLYSKLSRHGGLEKQNEPKNGTERLGFDPYDYQKVAAEMWMEKSKGIIAFATGTGKTKTAIYAFDQLMKKEGAKVFLITVPDKTLVEQWSKELLNYWGNLVKCYSENNQWVNQLKNKIDYWKLEPDEPLFIVTTNQTFHGEKFTRQIKKLNKDYVFLADECHRLGTDNLLNSLPNVERRLGLSATPSIYMSEEKTDRLFNYFGGIIAEYSLEKAIEDGKLTQYEYHPVKVRLSDDEMEKYKELTHKIVKMLGNDDENSLEGLSLEAQMLLFKRARIIYGAYDKIIKLESLLDKLKDQRNMLIYCGATSLSEGIAGDNGGNELDQSNTEASKKQIEIVNQMLKGKGILAAQYTKDENGNERQDRIDAFKSGVIDTLVAIKALDEGVDIPEISIGIIMASSGNPREFIQRRGRLLRKSAGKEIAIIYDMVVLGEESDYDGINMTELKRIAEFSKAAKNRNEILDEYQELFDRYLEEKEDE